MHLQVLNKNSISHPVFTYRNLVYKAYSFKHSSMDLSTALNLSNSKGYDFEIIVYSLNLVSANRYFRLLIASLRKNQVFFFKYYTTSNLADLVFDATTLNFQIIVYSFFEPCFRKLRCSTPDCIHTYKLCRF